MSQKIGDLTLDILLNIKEAENGAKQITASLKNVEGVTNKVIQSSSDLTGKMGKLGFALNAVRDAGQILGSSLSTIFNTIRASNDAYQQFLSSNRQLEATSKLTGANLKELNKVSEQTKDQFSLTADQSNLFTIELTKLGQKAGDVSKVQESINALMNLGAGQGLDAEQTLYAIKQAILGIDEGTDKLFQKNPSVLYDEFAKKIGTTAGKLTDQQKSQALLDAVMKNGSILNGQYSSYLETAAGKQQKLNAQIQDAKIKLGEQLQPVLLTFLTHINNLVSLFGSLSPSTQKWIVILGTMSITVGKLIPLIITFKDTFGGLNSSILKLGNDAPNAFGKVEKSGLSVFGKGSLLFAALLATIGLIDSILDNIDKAAREKRKLMNQPTPQPIVPPGFKSEDGVLKKDDSTPTMDWDLYKKNTINSREETKKLEEAVKETKIEIEKIGNTHIPGKSPAVKEIEEQISRYAELQKQNDGIGKKLLLNAGYEGAINDLLEQRKKIENEMEYVRTGIDLEKIKEESKDLFDRELKRISDEVQIKREQTRSELDEYFSAVDQIHSLKIELMDDEHAKKLAQIEFERDKEIEAIKQRNISEEQRGELIKLTNEKFDKEQKNAGINLDDFNAAHDIASQIQNILQFGSYTLFSKFLSALQVTQQIVSLLQSLQIAQGIFSFIGKILGFALAPVTGGASVALAGTTGPGDSSSGNLGSMGNRLGQFSNYANKAAAQVIREPYFVSISADGRNLKAVINNVDKIDNARLK